MVESVMYRLPRRLFASPLISCFGGGIQGRVALRGAVWAKMQGVPAQSRERGTERSCHPFLLIIVLDATPGFVLYKIFRDDASRVSLQLPR